MRLGQSSSPSSGTVSSVTMLDVELLKKKLSEHFELRGFDWVRIQHAVQEVYSGRNFRLKDGRDVTILNCWIDAGGHLTLRLAGGQVVDYGEVL